jgi:hypothetical protein
MRAAPPCIRRPRRASFQGAGDAEGHPAGGGAGAAAVKAEAGGVGALAGVAGDAEGHPAGAGPGAAAVKAEADEGGAPAGVAGGGGALDEAGRLAATAVGSTLQIEAR